MDNKPEGIKQFHGDHNISNTISKVITLKSSIWIINDQASLKIQKLVLKGLAVSAGRKPARCECMYEAENAIPLGSDKYGGYKLTFSCSVAEL